MSSGGQQAMCGLWNGSVFWYNPLPVHVNLGNILFITGKGTGCIKHQQICIAYQEQSTGNIIGFTDSDGTADKPFLVSSPQGYEEVSLYFSLKHANLLLSLLWLFQVFRGLGSGTSLHLEIAFLARMSQGHTLVVHWGASGTMCSWTNLPVQVACIMGLGMYHKGYLVCKAEF